MVGGWKAAYEMVAGVELRGGLFLSAQRREDGLRSKLMPVTKQIGRASCRERV